MSPVIVGEGREEEREREREREEKRETERERDRERERQREKQWSQLLVYYMREKLCHPSTNVHTATYFILCYASTAEFSTQLNFKSCSVSFFLLLFRLTCRG